jgi:glycosyltransferase involved in cell wall biosynthesis
LNLDSDPISDESAARVAATVVITVPTKDRQHLLFRALASVGRAVGSEADRVELTLSDGSADDASAQAVELFLAGWAGRHRYVHNRPALPLVDNMNRAIELASGQWVMQLDDDDYALKVGDGVDLPDGKGSIQLDG